MADGGRYSKRTVSASSARAQRSSARAKGREALKEDRARTAEAKKRASKLKKKNATVFDAASIVKAAKRKDATLGSVGAAAGKAIVKSKAVLISLIVVAALLLAGAVDGVSHWGKAYGNVTVGGMDVSGMTQEQIVDALQQKYGPRLESRTVDVYASQQAYDDEQAKSVSQTQAEDAGDDMSVEEEYGDASSWKATAFSLGATIDYEGLAAQAMEQGRGAGPFSRIGLRMNPASIPVAATFDDAALEAFAAQVDTATDDPRLDATVQIEDGIAYAVEGHDGKMVDRTWLADQLSIAFTGDVQVDYLIAAATDAPARTTMQQAQDGAAAVNRAIAQGALFRYEGESWDAGAADVGGWVRTSVVQTGEDAYNLVFSIDADAATQSLMSNVNARVSADDVTVSFEVEGDDVFVHTQGDAEIPDVGAAIANFNELLFGPNGKAWDRSASANPVTVDVLNSSAPDTMTLGQARELGIVTAIGWYTTEFSNDSGTENRNHNIKLAADLLNNSVAPANGGVWSFNDTAGDTNQDPPFASAGSIVNGEFVDSIGGGICQVATTIFNAVYDSGLEVTTRWNHSVYMANYPTGRDAAVSYPDLDLVWRNDLTSDVLLQMSYTDTSITATLYGVDPRYTVYSELGDWEDGDKYETAFEHDDDLPDDYSYLKTYGYDGSKVTVSRTVYDEEGLVVRENVFTSVYPPRDEVYVVGPNTDTKKLERDYEPEQDEPAYEEAWNYDDPYGYGYYYDSDDTYDYGGYDDDAYGYYGEVTG